MRPFLPALLLLASVTLSSGRPAGSGSLSVPAIDAMPDLPQSLVLRDWLKVAHGFDALAFDFDAQGEHLPLIWWRDDRGTPPRRVFALPSYVGDTRQLRGSDHFESIPALGAVLGSTWAGIDKRNQDGRNWVEMLKGHFHRAGEVGLYTNNPDGFGGSFWYQLLPNLLFFQIYDRYPGDPEMKEQLIEVARHWREACVALGAGPESLPDFNHTGFDFRRGAADEDKGWREPDAAAGVAWLEYMAHVTTGDPTFLEAARWGMDFLEARTENPFYEILLPYGAYLAARMNAEQGTRYDTGKLINWVFEGDCPRRWGVLREEWNGTPVHGLMGAVNRGHEYAFTMNSWLAPAVMIPLVRYDARWARAMGKWLLHVALNSRYFYSDAWPAEQQSSREWAERHDPESVLAYEGLRKQGIRRSYPVEERTVAGGARETGPGKRGRRGEGEILEADGNGVLERLWKFSLAPGTEHIFVLEGPDWEVGDFEVCHASSADGPWESLFRIAPGRRSRDRHWAPLPEDGDRWIRLRGTGLAAGQELRVDRVFVNSKFATSPWAAGDPTFMRWGDTDFGLYGSAFVGALAALAVPTDVDGILRVDCRATESFAAPSYPTYLFYNPHSARKTVRFKAGPDAVDLYDTVTGQVVSRNQKGETPLELEAGSAAVIVLVPAGVPLEKANGRLSAAGVIIDYGL
jgi:hypothetical protein